MIHLVKRPLPSRAWSMATPLVAVLATMLFGGLLFWALGNNPFIAIRTIFWDPLFGEFAFFLSSATADQGRAADPDCHRIAQSGVSSAGIWNIGAEGQYIIGALVGAGVGLGLLPRLKRGT
jgi:ABC-type uncharacterized transport system permease subunit